MSTKEITVKKFVEMELDTQVSFGIMCTKTSVMTGISGQEMDAMKNAFWKVVGPVQVGH